MTKKSQTLEKSISILVSCQFGSHKLSNPPNNIIEQYIHGRWGHRRLISFLCLVLFVFSYTSNKSFSTIEESDDGSPMILCSFKLFQIFAQLSQVKAAILGRNASASQRPPSWKRKKVWVGTEGGIVATLAGNGRKLEIRRLLVSVAKDLMIPTGIRRGEERNGTFQPPIHVSEACATSESNFHR